MQISREDAQAFARENRIHYMEASAKNRYNVDEAFLELVHIIRYSLSPELSFPAGTFFTLTVTSLPCSGRKHITNVCHILFI